MIHGKSDKILMCVICYFTFYSYQVVIVEEKEKAMHATLAVAKS